MSRKPRKSYTPQEKVAILREHLLEGKPISDVCQRHQLQPTVFYAWQKTFFENGAAAFAKTAGSRANSQAEQRISRLEDKLKRKDEVIAEIMAEHILLKKELGES